MCGLAGILAPAGREREGLAAAVARMGATLVHRGPDDEGSWVDPGAGIALTHRRLSILDLSSAGHQPMLSASGRHVLAYNGETYNHLELRAELERRGLAPAAGWRGHSDTETLLAACDAWGLEATLERAVGMFALALWDRSEQTLFLARDRMGEKPLYYGRMGGLLLFGSELKALRAHAAFVPEVDRQALGLFLRHACVPAPRCIYRGIAKLPAGTWVACRPGAAPEPPRAYWSLADAALAGARDPFTGDEHEAVEELDRRLAAAVAGQAVADVPLGAFLSGGIDSSAVVAALQKSAPGAVRTFTIGFAEQSYDEAAEARAVAAHLGTRHEELRVSPADALAVVPRLPELYDEPFADSSQIPTFLVAQMARRHVTVSLSGDGGDELFGGYNRHSWVPRIWRRAGGVPAPMRRLAGAGLRAFSPAAWDRAFAAAGSRQRNPGDKLHKVAGVLAADGPAGIYRTLVSQWQAPGQLVRGFAELAVGTGPGLSVAEDIMVLDSLGYLPDDILVKVDRAAMGVSLETRVPFLDHRLVEFAWRLPLSMKIRDGQGKWIVRQWLHRHVPRHLVDRPKTGFGIPLDAWLRGPLRPWAEDLLDPGAMAADGHLEPGPVQAAWREHLSGRRNRAYELWAVLMFQAWRRRWL